MYIRRYTSQQKSEWDAFVDSARNATFLFFRDYMDYHSDRFCDCSLMAFDDHDRLIALLPASIEGNIVTSHAGLTYGGWILGAKSPDMLAMMEIWPLMIDIYRSLGAESLIYRPVPHIYHNYPSEEDLYALFRHGATLDRVLASSVIDLVAPIKISDTVRWHVNRARRVGVSISESVDIGSFWEMLTCRLHDRYSSAPVHTLEEICLLKSRFPDNIKLVVAVNSENRLLAGVMLYICGNVVKAQYTASTYDGREVNALDAIYVSLASRLAAEGYRYFDLGTSNEDGGLVLNEGLIRQKSSYGARVITYPSFLQPL